MCIRDRGRSRLPARPGSLPSPSWGWELLMSNAVSYTHLRAHETGRNLVCRLLLLIKRRPQRPTPLYSSAASDVYKRQGEIAAACQTWVFTLPILGVGIAHVKCCLLYTSPSPRDRQKPRMPSSAFNKTTTPETYTSLFVGSVRCV